MGGPAPWEKGRPGREGHAGRRAEKQAEEETPNVKLVKDITRSMPKRMEEPIRE